MKHIHKSTGLRTRHMSERKFLDLAYEKGWTIYKKGWPDFLLCREDGDICMVEVKKSARNGLKKHQKIVCGILAGLGVKVFLWNPESGFKKINAETHPTSTLPVYRP